MLPKKLRQSAKYFNQILKSLLTTRQRAVLLKAAIRQRAKKHLLYRRCYG
nr:MAG TPA: hypothetical protein [Caudoviricetes sp.]